MHFLDTASYFRDCSKCLNIPRERSNSALPVYSGLLSAKSYHLTSGLWSSSSLISEVLMFLKFRISSGINKGCYLYFLVIMLVDGLSPESLGFNQRIAFWFMDGGSVPHKDWHRKMHTLLAPTQKMWTALQLHGKEPQVALMFLVFSFWCELLMIMSNIQCH